MITARLYIKSNTSTMERLETWVVVHDPRWWKGVKEVLRFQCHSRAENPRKSTNLYRGSHPPLARRLRQPCLFGLVLRSVFHCDQTSVIPAVRPLASFHSPDARHHVFDGDAETAYKAGYLEHDPPDFSSRSCVVPLVFDDGGSANHSREKMASVEEGSP